MGIPSAATHPFLCISHIWILYKMDGGHTPRPMFLFLTFLCKVEGDASTCPPTVHQPFPIQFILSVWALSLQPRDCSDAYFLFKSHIRTDVGRPRRSMHFPWSFLIRNEWISCVQLPKWVESHTSSNVPIPLNYYAKWRDMHRPAHTMHQLFLIQFSC